MPPTSPTSICANCSSSRLVGENTDLATCLDCGATLCDFCDQVMEAYKRPDGEVARRHERDDLVAPSCPAHKAEVVRHRRSRMRLIQGGAA